MSLLSLLAVTSVTAADFTVTTACQGRVSQSQSKPNQSLLTRVTLLQVWCQAVGEGVFTPLEVGGVIAGPGDVQEVVVSLADSDGDGQVVFRELLDFAEVHISAAFTTLDLDHDGIISTSEAATFTTTASSGMISSLARKLFTLGDLDRDGVLTTKDLPDTIRHQLDQDKDGRVSLKELLGHPVIFFPGPVQSVYKVLDSDKDEAVSEKEADNFINFLGRILNVLDSDSDCFVSVEEALGALDRAGLSKVTLCFEYKPVIVSVQDFQLSVQLLVQPY